jgi:hypothetical protein
VALPSFYGPEVQRLTCRIDKKVNDSKTDFNAFLVSGHASVQKNGEILTKYRKRIIIGIKIFKLRVELLKKGIKGNIKDT